MELDSTLKEMKVTCYRMGLTNVGKIEKKNLVPKKIQRKTVTKMKSKNK